MRITFLAMVVLGEWFRLLSGDARTTSSGCVWAMALCAYLCIQNLSDCSNAGMVRCAPPLPRRWLVLHQRCRQDTSHRCRSHTTSCQSRLWPQQLRDYTVSMAGGHNSIGRRPSGFTQQLVLTRVILTAWPWCSSPRVLTNTALSSSALAPLAAAVISPNLSLSSELKLEYK
ncbi:hypothetical protein C8Q70DRAFT_280598 [Cubamyces menziesii]|nr:hypothetical protein C8Q70DRAFT_280598 [Cubamyces menziesii]